ncbi:hypothetical protein [Salinibacterium sp. M195]|uniref:hypothetical protein n=1 Tax=Salinibacterium sp. M195 TaxID=2583374 RepID=UPI001C638A52|nr:hypothetical protein [Salinibacterium sp. M195]QYH35333.1 hypothetical protein FFT87_04850 [Salinibacterium sp. M195]
MTMTRLWNVIGAVAVLLILVLGYVGGVSPALTSATNSDSELESVELQNTVKANELAALKELSDNSEKLMADLAAVQLAVPSTHESSVYGSQLAQIAAAAGVTLVTVGYVTATEAVGPVDTTVPAAPVEGEEATDDAAEAPAVEPGASQSAETVPSVPGLVSLGISVTATGSYAALNSFVNAVQANKRSMSVTSVEIRVAPQSGEFDLVLLGSVYVLQNNTPPLATSGETES